MLNINACNKYLNFKYKNTFVDKAKYVIQMLYNIKEDFKDNKKL